MNYPKPQIIIEAVPYDVISFEEFRILRGLLLLSNQSIDYNLEKDRLDYTTIGRFRYIIWNEKAQTFNLNYKKTSKPA